MQRTVGLVGMASITSYATRAICQQYSNTHQRSQFLLQLLDNNGRIIWLLLLPQTINRICPDSPDGSIADGEEGHQQGAGAGEEEYPGL